jgi:hypothetical protein
VDLCESSASPPLPASLTPLPLQDSGPSGPYRSFAVASYQHTQHLRSDQIRTSDTVCGVPDCAISTPTYRLGHSYKETLMKKQNPGTKRIPLTTTTNKSSPASCGGACDCSHTILQTLPLVVALDSLGGVTCSRLTLSPTPVSCSAKVAASHISGVSFISLDLWLTLSGSKDLSFVSLWDLISPRLLHSFGPNLFPESEGYSR